MTSAESGVVQFRLLGSVEAVRDGTPIQLGGRRQRQLLALLLLEPGRPVPVDRLTDELWAGRAPPGADTTLRSYVSRLRKALGADAAITRGDAAYVLDVPRGQIDRQEFQRLIEEGREAFDRGAARRAGQRLRSALELWNGRPFGELADEGVLRLEADRLEELRLLALEERIETDLALGVDAELVGEVEAILDRHPYRERLWRQLMLALYHAGRQAEALAAYRRARATLDDELGLEPSEELRALEQSILRQEVPSAQPPEERTNLRAPLTSFIGRERELAAIERLLAAERLVTLTGVGGVGKTRLALEAAMRAALDFPDGVYFVDFSGLAEPSLVAGHVAAALDVHERADAPVSEQLAGRLRDAGLLLVLDNCEHLREVCGELVQSLLGGCPRLVVLSTGREPLGVPGEIDYSVQPLEVPPSGASSDKLQSADAVRLFLSRARAVRPQLADDASVVSSVADICRDLDGLPLAIELAAARAKALSLDDIAVRLADRFRFLVSWRRLTPARHRTLREAMDWSYDLLSDDEKHLLARLSVFAGGFTLDAAASTCLDGDSGRAVDPIARLVDASLVVAEERGGATRYRLLETVRQYAAERLEETGGVDEVRDRHAEWFLTLAEEAEPQLSGDEQTRWFATLDAEADNLRSALAYLSARGRSETQLRLTIALSRFWYVRGHLAEARQWLEQAIADGDDHDPALRRRAFTAAAAVALLQGEYGASTAFAEQALVAARGTDDRRLVANGLSNLGAIVLAAGDHERAAAVLEEAVALARDVGDTRIAALAINNLGDLALTVGDYARAEPLFEESLALLRARGDTSNISRSLFNLGAVALQSDRLEDAAPRFHESLTLAEEAGDKEDLAWCLEGVAALAAANGSGEGAAVLLGAAGALLESMGAAFKPFERRLHDETEAGARGLCGSPRFEAEAKNGAALELAEALAYARTELDAV